MNKKISFFSLVILIVSSIDNMKNLPVIAFFGSELIPFFALAALIFLVPSGLVAAELSARFPDKGGIFHWVGMAFGKKWGLAAIWLQWINTMVWYPTMLVFIAATLAYLIHPDLAQNKVYLVSCVLILFWVLTWINLKGVQTSAKLNNIFAIAGMAVPMLLLILLGGIWIKVGHPQQIDFKIVPPLTESANWVSLIAIMASFLGIELSSVHVNDIHRPQKNFPKAILTACIAIVLSMGLGALSIAMVLPKKEIYLVSGIMQVFAHLFDVFGLNILTPILTLLIVMGSLGTMINWVISPAKGLLNAAESGLLPAFFSRKNQAGVASNILLAQALLVSIFCLLFLLEPNVNGSFWFLTALSTELYMMMYLLMFSAVLWLRASSKDSTSFKIPGGAFGLWTTCSLGLIGCISTIIISFFPPENIHIGHPVKYLVTICAGNLITISPLFIFYFAARQKTKRGLSRVELE